MPNFFDASGTKYAEGPVLTVETMIKGMLEFERIWKANKSAEEVPALIFPQYIIINPNHPHNFHIWHRHCGICEYLRKQRRKQARLRHK